MHTLGACSVAAHFLIPGCGSDPVEHEALADPEE